MVADGAARQISNMQYALSAHADEHCRGSDQGISTMDR